MISKIFQTAFTIVFFTFAAPWLAGQIGSEQIDPTFNPAIGFPGRILASAKQSDGKLIVGGVFSNVNGVSCYGITRILDSGAVYTEFSLPVVNDAIIKITLQSDDKILIAGNFSQINGETRNKLARLNGDGTVDASFNPSVDSKALAKIEDADFGSQL